MKIILVVHSLRKGGAETIALQNARYFLDKNYQVHIICWVEDVAHDLSKFKNVTISYLVQKDKYNFLKGLLFLPIKLSMHVKAFNPDAIIFHSFTTLLISFLIPRQIKKIFVCHGYGEIELSTNFKTFLKKIFSKWIIKSRSFKIVLVSSSMSSAATKFFNMPGKQFKIIENGINQDIYKPTVSIEEKLLLPKKIIMIGTLAAHKGQFLGVKAFSNLLLECPSLQLLIVGEGPDQEFIKASISKLDAFSRSRINMLGERDNIPALLHDCNILWQLSKSEAMPLSVIEALSCAVPCIGFDVRGINDCVRNGYNGYLIEYGDLDQLRNMTKLLINDDVLYSSFSRNAFKSSKRFSLDKMNESYNRIIIGES